jgi:lysophospholipase L1-like esterase
MTTRWNRAIALLSAALVLSLALNAFLALAGIRFHRRLTRARLDPLGAGGAAPGAAERIASGGKPTVVFLGDSRARAWPPPASITNAVFLNHGIDGQTTAQILGRFARQIGPLKPDVVVLQAGVNDLRMIPFVPADSPTIIENCKRNIERTVGESLACGARVVLTTIFPLGSPPLDRRILGVREITDAINEVNGFLVSLAGDRVSIFDTGRILADESGAVASVYAADFLHLNDAGYAALNRELAGCLIRRY